MASEEKDTNDPDFKVEKSGSAKKERKFLYNKNWEEVPEFRGEKIRFFFRQNTAIQILREINIVECRSSKFHFLGL